MKLRKRLNIQWVAQKGRCNMVRKYGGHGHGHGTGIMSTRIHRNMPANKSLALLERGHSCWIESGFPHLLECISIRVIEWLGTVGRHEYRGLLV